jgi:HEAT repeat protein
MIAPLLRRLRALTLAGVVLSAACGVPAPPNVADLAAKAGKGDAGAIEGLVGLLGASQPAETRAAAYEALLAAGTRTAPKVLGVCRDEDPTRREHALALAGNLKLPGAYEEAVVALGDRAFPRRYVAAWTLGELGDARAVGPLLAAVSRESGEAAREAARSLVKLGQPSAAPVRAALPTLRGEAKGYAIRILGELRDAQAVPLLEAVLADPTTRADAAWALGTLGLPEAGPALEPLLADPEWRVRLEACRSLGLLEVRAADRPLDRLRESDPVPAVREWAARSLGLLRGKPQTFPNALGQRVEPENLYR